MSLERRIGVAAIYVVPGLAITAASAILLFGRARTGLAARVYGGPPAPGSVAAWRVVAVERSYAVESPLRGVGLLLTASDGATQTSAQGVTDDEGAWEARLPLPAGASSVRVQVRTLGPDPRVLAANQVPVHPPNWNAALHVEPLPIPGQVTGQWSISVSPVRGALASPYPEQVVVQVRDRARGEPVAGVKLSLHGDWITVDGAAEMATDQQGSARATLRVANHDVRLHVQARAPSGEQGEWTGALPVTPGGLWIEPGPSEQGRIVLQSPVAHHYAYVTTFTRHARLESRRIALTPDQGGAAAQTEVPKPPADAWILVSPDAPGRETNAIGWPVPAPDGSPRASAELRTPLLADGIAMAEQQVHKQSMRTRVRALTIVGLAAVLESFLLWWRATQERAEAEAALASQPDLDDALRSSLASGATFWMRMVIAVAIVAVGFFSVALVTWLGTR